MMEAVSFSERSVSIYTVQHPKRQPSSYSSPEMSPRLTCFHFLWQIGWGTKRAHIRFQRMVLSLLHSSDEVQFQWTVKCKHFLQSLWTLLLNLKSQDRISFPSTVFRRKRFILRTYWLLTVAYFKSGNAPFLFQFKSLLWCKRVIVKENQITRHGSLTSHFEDPLYLASSLIELFKMKDMNTLNLRKQCEPVLKLTSGNLCSIAWCSW
jgi:hypothetical protein